jgi:hypothetical protein
VASDDLPELGDLSALVALVERERGLYVRWSRGPRRDLTGPASIDDLTGVPLPGLSASPLDIEGWWDGRPLRLWVARRLYDYSHLRVDKGADVHPWVLRGREVGRGPDNEPLVDEVEPLARLAGEVIAEASEEVESAPGRWGALRRTPPGPGHYQRR